MFQPETEDMLPRSAPMPSDSNVLLGAEPTIKPLVPEISILYGEKEETVRKIKRPVRQTYDAWRKSQLLPRVTFPLDGVEVPCESHHSANSVGSNKYRSNLYPLRTAVAQPIATTTVGFTTTNQTDASTYRRSLDSLPVKEDMSSNIKLQHIQEQQQQRRSLETIGQFNSPITTPRHEVLTICASTQTENTGSPSTAIQCVQNVATKQDVEQLMVTILTMQQDQTRLMQICEALLMQQQLQPQAVDVAPTKSVRDASVQCDTFAPTETDSAQPAALEANSRKVPATKNYYASGLQSPRVPPIAQSTAYNNRANSPYPNCGFLPQPQPFEKQTNDNMTNVLPKASTEKSMVMNELAFKYLPSEKLNELMHELHVAADVLPVQITGAQPTAAANTPLHAIENLGKQAGDISNASYKYLKKYRLLPEGHMMHDEHLYEEPQKTPSARTHEQHQQRQSPYQCGVQTPLALNAASVPTADLVDLEQIRNQPKLL